MRLAGLLVVVLVVLIAAGAVAISPDVWIVALASASVAIFLTVVLLARR